MSTPKKKRCKYPHHIDLRISDELFEKISNEAIATDLTLSEYLRQLLSKRRPTIKNHIVADYPEIKKLTAEFGKIGSNINQIAHYYNAGGDFNSEIHKQLERALTQLYEMKFKVERMCGDFHSYSQAHPREK